MFLSRTYLLAALITFKTKARISADFLGAFGANAPGEKNVVGATHPEEFGP